MSLPVSSKVLLLSELYMIGTVRHEMKWYSRNNRRLWCFKVCTTPLVARALFLAVLCTDLLPQNLYGESYSHPLSPFQCRLSLHCCCNCYCYCYCFPRLEALLDAPCASLTLPVVRRSHQSFRSPAPNTVLQVAVVPVSVVQAVALAEAATPNRCYCYPFTVVTWCWWRWRLPPFVLRAMSLALRLLNLRFLGGLNKTIAGSLQSSVTFSGHRQDCFNAGPALFWMIHRLFTTCSCVGTSRALVCLAKLLKVGSAQRRASHLPKFGHQWRQRNCRMWLQHRQSDPDSVATVFQCVWC